MRRPSAATVALVVAGLALVLGPIALPAQPPPDRVEYAVEPIERDEASWETLEYANLTERTRTAVYAAHAAVPGDAPGSTGHHEVSVATGDELPPLASHRRPVVAFDLQIDGEWYLLQVTTFDPPIPAREHVVRLAALAVGIALVAAGGYHAARN